MERLKMTIAKRSKGLNWQQSQKKQCSYWSRNASNFISTVLFATLIGTYLDLYFVGSGFYFFPMRPFPTIFSINILFTLIGLPFLIGFFIILSHRVILWKKIGMILILSLFMSITEKMSEAWGFFSHNESWKHIYSFIGYSIFLTVIYSYYHLFTQSKR
jgi:hypothetical protein